MKKLSILMLSAVVALTSCSKSVESEVVSAEPVSTEEVVTVNFNIFTETATRAVFDENDQTLEGMRLFVMITKDGVVVDQKSYEDYDPTSDSDDLDLSFRLLSGVEYGVSAWADFGDAYYSVVDSIGATPSVSYIYDENDEIYVVGSDMKYDAFFDIQPVTFDANGDSQDLELTRPFGLIKVNTTDANTAAVVNAGLVPTSYTATYTIPAGISLVDGKITAEAVVSVAGKLNVSTTAPTSEEELNYDYIFATEGEQTVRDYTVKYIADSDEYVEYAFTSIPVQRNYITNIIGKILTKEGDVTITVNQGWSTDADGNFDIAY